MFAKKDNLLGLDVGSHSVKMLQLKLKDGSFHLAGLGLAPLPREAFSEGRVNQPELVANRIKTLFKNLKLKGKLVAAGVSGYDVMIKKIEVPAMSEKELDNRMQSELGQYIPYRIEEVDVDYQIMDLVKDSPNSMEVLLVAAKKESVSEHVNMVRQSNMSTQVMDVDFFALNNAFETTYGVSDGTVALLDIGSHKAIMNIMIQNFTPYTRALSIGGSQITDAIKDRFKLTFDEAERMKLGYIPNKYSKEELQEIVSSVIRNWISEFKRVIDFYLTNYPHRDIEKIYLSGGSCRIPGLKKVFHEHMDIDVDIFNPLNKINYDSKAFDPAYLDYIGPQMAISLGLALRKAG